MQAVPDSPGTMVILESTANGCDYFKELWDRAVNGDNDFVPVFFPWHEMKEYRRKYDGFQLTKAETVLKKAYNLDNEQLAWRRWCIRNNCGGDEQLFRQEYPSAPEEAFILTGRCIFDKEKISSRLAITNSSSVATETKTAALAVSAGVAVTISGVMGGYSTNIANIKFMADVISDKADISVD